jgi:cytochrome c oxidase cbb3-type subunit 1
MSSTPSHAPIVAPDDADLQPPVPAAEIDASCRIPLMFLVVCAALWLVAASLLGMVAAIKFHAPNFLANCAWLTYGRIHPSHLNALIYGFGVQAGFAALLWLVCH